MFYLECKLRKEENMQIINSAILPNRQNYDFSCKKNYINCNNLTSIPKDTISFGNALTEKHYDLKNKLLESQNQDIASKNPEEIREKYNNGNLTEKLIADTVMDIYSKYRHTGKYAVEYKSENFDKDYYEVRRYSHRLLFSPVKTINQGGWQYRLKKHLDNITERISLNVNPNADMLKNLDSFMTKGIYTDKNGNQVEMQDHTPFYYKIPSNRKEWQNRQDPITLYFEGEIDDKTLNAIRDITKSSQRGSLNSSEIAKDYNWMLVEKSPSDEEIDDLFKRIEKNGKTVNDAIINNFTRHNFTSVGLFKAVEAMLDELDCLKQNEQ